MTNGAILLIEEPAIFSPISQLNYEFYVDKNDLSDKIPDTQNLQCTVGKEFTDFGKSQSPAITDYADGVDTLQFLTEL